jgi:hypothetical protein
LADLEGVARELLDALTDAPAVEWAQREGLENEEVQGALEDIGRRDCHAGSPVE